MLFGKKQKVNIVTNQKKLPAAYLAVDIGTEFVKSVVYFIKDKEIEVIGYNRTRQRDSSMYAAFIINLQDVIDTVDKSIGEAITMAKEIVPEQFSLPSEIILGIAGELVQGVTILVNVEREKPDIPIKQKELDEFVEKVKKFTFSNTKGEIAQEMGLKVSQVEEVNTYINSVYIDGSRVNNPLDYKGKELIYKVFSTFAPRIHLDSINQVAQNLNLKIKHIVVEPYALALGLKNMRDPNSNAIIIDIGGGTTDVALIQNGDIVGTKMFAIGGKVFTKRVERELNVSYEEAQKIKEDYTDGKVSADVKKKLEKAFDQDISTWLAGVEISLESFQDVNEYPSAIYLCGGGALLPEIQEGLMTYPWLQTLNFKKFPKVNFVFPNGIKDVKDLTRHATLPMDVTPLALARMALEIN